MTKGPLFLVLPLLLLLAAGCEKNPNAPARLSGTVKYKGNPVTAGTVTLYAKEGGVYTANISKDGTYSVSEVPAGETGVSIETESANTNKPKPDQYGGAAAGKAPKGSPNPYQGDNSAQPAGGAYVKIPAKYAKKESSGLTVTLGRGGNSKDFDLTD